MSVQRRAEVTALARSTLIRAWRPTSGVWSSAELAVRHLTPIPVEKIAKQLFGLDVEWVPSISSEHTGLEISACLDIPRHLITIANGPGHTLGEQHITLAHEIYHYIRHRGLSQTVYRERMMKGNEIDDWTRPLREREADWFAVDFTMPEGLVTGAFHDRYGVPIPLDLVDEQLVYWLESGTKRRLSISDIQSRGINYLRYLSAVNTWFAGKHFDSLVDHFRVTPTAMGIRLRELHLVR